ncbi:MAG: DUF4384 domain-containing protein [Acidobacteriota bacterium]|nr:DUF4384 domain-containing protein [Acidobacteriota bacterium]
MKRQTRSSQTFAIIAAGLMLLALSSMSTRAFAQEQDTERRFWPPNFRPAAPASTKPAPSTRPAKYKLTSPALEKGAVSTAIGKDAVVGITIWRLRDAEDADKNVAVIGKEEGARILVVRKGKKSSAFSAERVEASTAFTAGQKLRLSIEIPRSGYVYVIDREQYEDGSLSEPYLAFPVDAKDDNKVVAGRVIEIPNSSGEEPYLEVQPLRSDNPKSQVAEVLTVLVTLKPLAGLPKPVRNDQGEYEPLKLSKADVEKWEKQWATQVEHVELEGGAGQTYTRSEQAAGSGKKRLTQDDPLPQTVFRVATKPGKPLLVKLPLKISK